MDGELVAVFSGALDLVQVAEINLRVNALGEQVQAQRDQVHISGALTVSEQATLDAISAGHIAKLCRSDCCSPVVVRVQAENDVLAVVQVPRHPLNRVRIQIRCCHFHGGWQVDDDFAIRSRLQDVQHLVTDLKCKLELCSRVALRRVLVIDVGVWNHRLHRPAELGAFQGDVDNALLVGAEHHLTLQSAR